MSSSTSPDSSTLRALLARHSNELGLLLAILLVLAFTAAVSDSYQQRPLQNAREILRQTSLLGIFALGAAVVIISGGIDLSSGSVIAFSATSCTSILLLLAPIVGVSPNTAELSVGMLLLAFSGTVAIGVLIGSFHAWLITSIGLPPFVATLASLVGLRSLARLVIEDVTAYAYGRPTGSTQIYINNELYHQFGTVWWIPLLVFLVLSAVLWVLLSKTVVGRHLYAMGGNEEAARLSGIRTTRLKWLAYCIGAVTASIAGILHSSYISMAEPVNDGLGYELSAIAAAVVGGCSLTGGIGAVVGVMMGALFLRVVIHSVAMTIDKRPDVLEGLVVGVLVVLAVAFNELRSSGGLRKQFFPGALGALNVLILTVLAGVITAVTSEDNQLRNAALAATGALLLLALRAFLERRALGRQHVG